METVTLYSPITPQVILACAITPQAEMTSPLAFAVYLSSAVTPQITLASRIELEEA